MGNFLSQFNDLLNRDGDSNVPDVQLDFESKYLACYARVFVLSQHSAVTGERVCVRETGNSKGTRKGPHREDKKREEEQQIQQPLLSLYNYKHTKQIPGQRGIQNFQGELKIQTHTHTY
jgi:hypothetical protein